MAAPGGVPNNHGGRVTTRELYEALEKQNRDRSDQGRRIFEKLDELCVSVGRQDERTKRNTEEIEKLRNRSNWIDVGLGAFTVVMAAISNVFGPRQ
jgi:hypothetical protein